MSKLLSRHDRWELWMAATPDAPAAPSAGTPSPALARPQESQNSAELVREVERLRGVIQTAVAALAFVGAHDEASRIRTALESH
jgi:hypothetical protein